MTTEVADPVPSWDKMEKRVQHYSEEYELPVTMDVEIDERFDDLATTWTIEYHECDVNGQRYGFEMAFMRDAYEKSRVDILDAWLAKSFEVLDQEVADGTF